MIEYKYRHDTGFDLYATRKVVIQPSKIAIIPLHLESTDIAILDPKSITVESKNVGMVGWGLFLYDKSSTSDWITLGRVVDIDYDDIILAKIYNISQKTLVIKIGQAVCQGVIHPVFHPVMAEYQRGPRLKQGGIRTQYRGKRK